MSDLLWIGKVYSKDDLYQIRWYKDGKEIIEFFTTQKKATEDWGDTCGELGYIHICENPIEGLRKYIQTLPLDLVDIVKI